MITGAIDADRVRSVDLFKGLGDLDFRGLLKSASLRQVPARNLLFEEGGLATTLYALIEGSVELFSERDDRRSTIAVIRSAKPCALASIVWGRNPMSARTLTPSQLLLVPAKVIHRLIESDTDFASASMRELAGAYHEAVEDIKNRSLRTATERLAYWMLRFDADAGGAGQFTIPCGKGTLASYLGMAPENLSRNLAALAPAGLAVRGRRVTLNDRPALAARAGVNLEQLAQNQQGSETLWPARTISAEAARRRHADQPCAQPDSTRRHALPRARAPGRRTDAHGPCQGETMTENTAPLAIEAAQAPAVVKPGLLARASCHVPIAG